jgi:hypothetical protein
MNTKSLLISLLMLASTQLFAQSTSYRTIVDDPDQLRNVGIRLHPFYFDFTTGEPKVEDATVNMGWGFDVFADPLPVLANKIGVVVKYRRSYLTIPEVSIDTQAVHATHFELGGTLDLFGGEKTVSRKLVVSENSNSTTSLMGVPMKRSTRFLAQGGIFRTRGPVEVFGSSKSVVSAFGLYGGFLIRSAVNYEANVSGYGNCKGGYRSNFYVNVLFAPAIKYTETRISGPGFNPLIDTKARLDSLDAISNLGGRMGYSYDFTPSRGLSFSLIAELGVRPPFNGVYSYFGSSVTINLGIGME